MEEILLSDRRKSRFVKGEEGRFSPEEKESKKSRKKTREKEMMGTKRER